MLLVDTNVWLAAADRGSDLHHQCAQIVRSHQSDLAATVPVIAETSWLILDRLGSDSHGEFLRLVVDGLLEVIELTESDWRRCLELVEQYADLRLDLMDASMVAVAERFGLGRLATLNRRDFTVVRPRHADAFELIP